MRFVVPKIASDTLNVTRVLTIVSPRVSTAKGRTSTTWPTKMTSACLTRSGKETASYEVAEASTTLDNTSASVTTDTRTIANDRICLTNRRTIANRRDGVQRHKGGEGQRGQL